MDFTENLAMGRTGEILIAETMQRQGWFVVPSYDFCGDEESKAPKLQGNGRSYVLPDLDASKNGQRIWVEVKSKTEPVFYHKTGKNRHGIPYRHIQSYLEVQRITGAPVFLAIIEQGTGQVLKARLDSILALGQLDKRDVMSRGGMMFWDRDLFRGAA